MLLVAIRQGIGTVRSSKCNVSNILYNLRGKRMKHQLHRGATPNMSTSFLSLSSELHNKIYKQLVLSGNSTLNHSFHCHLFAIHRTIYTKARRAGTSIRGPTVDTRAWSLLRPNLATATAIASSKLLLIAVKLWVLESRYPKPRRWHTMSVKKKIMTSKHSGAQQPR